MTTVTVYVPAGLTVEVIDRPAPPPPPPQRLTRWRLLGGVGGAVGAYFRRPVVLGNGDIWAAWGANNQAGRGSQIFMRSGNIWVKTSAQFGLSYDIGARENYGACFDRDRNIVWIGPGAPVAYGQTGDVAYDVVTGLYASTRIPGTGDGCSCLTYHAGALYTVGGWQGWVPGRRDLNSGVYAPIGGPIPPCTRQLQFGRDEEESPRLSYARGGIDSRNGVRWVLGNDNRLWMCSPEGVYAQIETTGDAPDTIGVVATLVEAADSIVAWCGQSGMTTGSPGVLRRQTWILDLASRIWRRGPGSQSGEIVPTGRVMCQSNLLSDGDSALLVLDSTSGTEIWQLT